jgi:Lon protease-like protein
MFPLSLVLFPGQSLSLNVFEPRYRLLVTECLEADRTFGVVLIARGSEVGGGDERFDVGTRAHIEFVTPLPDGRSKLFTRGKTRFRVERWLPDDPYPLAEVRDVADGEDAPEDLRAETAASVQRLGELVAKLRGLPSPTPTEGAPPAGWALCANAPLAALDAQRLLETDDPRLRMEQLARDAQALGEDVARFLSQFE